MEQRSAARRADGTAVESVLVCSRDSRPWRRQLGALAWAALEELALTAHHDDLGWASPAGVHAIATGIGTTDASALSALAALIRAGLVILEPRSDSDGRRCVYRLLLPSGVAVSDGPAEQHPARGFLLPYPGGSDALSTKADRHYTPGDQPCPTDQGGMADEGPTSRSRQTGGHRPQEQP
jgi:hypothetical protein